MLSMFRPVFLILLLQFSPDMWAQTDFDSFDFDLSASQKQEQSWRIGGAVDFRGQYRFTDTDWISTRLQSRFNVRYEKNALKIFASVNMHYDPATRSYQRSTRMELGEAYIAMNGKLFDITVGKQRIAWGTADGRSTIDRVNAIDFRDPVSNGRTSSRRPSWVVRLEADSEMGTWDFVWLPVGRDRKIPRHGSPWENSYLSFLRENSANGAFDLEIVDSQKPEVGLRFLRYQKGIDWGIAFFDGYTDYPQHIAHLEKRVELYSRRIQTWNISVAKGFGNSTLRGEFSYTPDYPLTNGESGLLTQSIIGWDRTFLTSLYINAQLFMDDLAGGKDSYGVTFAVTEKFLDESIEAGVRGQVLNHSRHSLELFGDYQFSDEIAISAKWVGFDGARNTLLGDYRNNDFLEISVSYTF